MFAWASALVVAAVGLLFRIRFGAAVPLTTGLAVLLFSMALLITFGNWVDSKTKLTLDLAGIRFRSPLRRASMGWDQVRSLRAIPVGRSWRVIVRSSDSQFQFRTASEIGLGSARSVRYGFPDGKEIAMLIRGHAGLKDPVRSDDAWICRA